MWVLSEIKEKVCCFINLTLDKSHFITEVQNENFIWIIKLVEGLTPDLRV